MGRYYHATRKASLAQIQREGLDPAHCSPTWEDDEELGPLIYMSDVCACAEDFAPPTAPGVILVLDIPEDFPLRHDLGEYTRSFQVIPPEFITHVVYLDW